MNDEDEDVKLGRNFFRAIQEDKMAQEGNSKAKKVAIYLFAGLIMIICISGLIIMVGGPK